MSRGRTINKHPFNIPTLPAMASLRLFAPVEGESIAGGHQSVHQSLWADMGPHRDPLGTKRET